MFPRRSLTAGLFALVSGFAAAQEPAAPIKPTAEERMYRGELSAAEQQLRHALADKPDDDEARLQLGIVCVLRALERFAQFHWEYGARADRILFGPIIRKNPAPNRITYPAWRRGFETLHQNLSDAEAILAGVKNKDVKVLLKMQDLQWDLEGDGKAEPIFPREIRGGDPLRDLRAVNPSITIGFDYADSLWLQGYCRMFLGLLDFTLAFDLERIFYLAAHEVYERPLLPEELERLSQTERSGRVLGEVIGNLRLGEPDRWRLARAHWIRATQLSEQLWQAVEQETDDDHEWLPNPRQKGILRLEVKPEMIEAWVAGMREGRAVLEGQKLVPLWFGAAAGEKRREGLNLKRLLDEPPKKILLLEWFNNCPKEYREVGEVYDERVFNRLNEVFGGRLLPFAIWAN